MNISQIKQSNFLTKADVGKGMLVTIKGDVFQENVAKEGAAPDMKYCLAFGEAEKPMVLNSTNAQLIAMVTGSEESEHWHGKKVVLYDDPSVSFGGKLVGGIRVRAPKQQPSKPTAQTPTGINNPSLRAAAVKPMPDPQSEEDDSVPF